MSEHLISGVDAENTSDQTKSISKGFIMAAGKSSRFQPNSLNMPKTLYSIHGESLLERNANLLDTAFELETLYLVAGSNISLIKDAVSGMSSLNASIQVIDVSDKTASCGLLEGFAAIADYVEDDEPFVCVLGDEYYGGGDHSVFAEFVRNQTEYSAVCAVKACTFPQECQKNYSAAYDRKNSSISGIVEKPARMDYDFFGLGLMAAKGAMARLAKEKCAEDAKLSPYELINVLVENGDKVLGCEFSDEYVNVNRPQDLELAIRQSRKKLFDSFSVDVVIPALNEEDCIGYVVRDFLSVCDKVIVMDNMSRDCTAQKAREAGATVYSQAMAGYGDAIVKGMDKSSAHIIAIAEADGTFRADDLRNMLGMLRNTDAVIGTRTYRLLIQDGAFMPFLLRMGNIAVGLLVSVLWRRGGARFTDVGCSLRAMWMETFQDIRPELVGKGPEFAPEVMLELLSKQRRVIEVPVSYYPRLAGDSKLSGSYFNSAKTALKMLALILRKRFRPGQK